MFRRLAGYDTALLAATLGLIVISLYLLFTAIHAPGGGLDRSFGWRQLVFSGLGLVVLVVLSRIDIARFERAWMPLYLTALGSIAIVFVLGTAIRGSRRWIELGPINLQPSETGKVLVVLAVAGFVARRARDIESPRVFLTTLGLCAVPALMVFLQPDFGTSQVYGYVCLALLFFAGARWLHFGMLAGGVVALAFMVLAVLPMVGVTLLHDYQLARLTGFINPEADPSGTNYQVIQSRTAIGSGQLSGRPQGEASQVSQGFLPEPQTDFIFATLTERHGFIGGAVVLALYMLFISRCMHATAMAPTMYGRLVCGAIATMYACQAVTNVGMVMGLMPITGVPMPLFSYGGSAQLANLAAVGLVFGVLRHSETAPVRYARRVGPTLAAARAGGGAQGGDGRARGVLGLPWPTGAKVIGTDGGRRGSRQPSVR